MITADFTKEGGLPFEQNTLAFMQFAYGETLNALLGHLTNSNATHFIISGCEIQDTNITNGWLVINDELLYFDSADGNASSKIAANTELFDATFENGTEHEIYTIKTAIIDDSGVALNTFVRIPNVSEFLTSLPDATETVEGIAEIATQSEANGTTDDNRIITAKKLNERTATTTRRGVVELATNTETQSGTDTTRVVTPANLESKTATETRKGIAEIATQTEANAGTDDTRMITPKKLVQAINDLVSLPPQATETVKGIAEIATQTEVNVGADDTRIVTPKKLRHVLPLQATETVKGIAELATVAETTTGIDRNRTTTPASLRSSWIRPLRATRGTLTTINRNDGQLQNNYNYNYAYVYPPSGFNMTHLVGFMPSIGEVYFAGNVDGNDTIWCRYQIQSTRIKVICNNSENRASSKINYLAIWQK